MIKIKKETLADGSTRWRARGVSVGRDPTTGKRRQVTITRKTKTAVEAELKRIGYQVDSGTYTPRWDGAVSEVLDDYLKSACFERADNTRVCYTGALLPARERLGKRKARSVTRQDVEDLRDWMLAEGRRRGGSRGTPLGPVSVRQTLGRLSAAFDLACQDGRLSVNPCRYVRAPSVPKRDGTTWSEAELRRFLAVADADRLAAAWRLTAYGLRRGEVCGLRWEDIDLAARTVTVCRARVLVEGRVVEKEPKSENGFRTLPLDDVLTAALQALHDRQVTEEMEAGTAYAASGYVVTDELGVPVGPDWFTNEFRRLAAKAGVSKIRLHDSRHTTNSLLAAAGVPPHIRAAWCGHTEAVNERTYTHARPEDLAAAGAALSKIIGAV